MPSQQLLEVERLDQVVVGARVQAANPILGGVPGGEHQDRQAKPPAPRLDDHLGSVQAWHSPVQHRRGEFAHPEHVQSVVTPFHGVDQVTVLAKAAGEHREQRPVVLGQQESHLRYGTSRQGAQGQAAVSARSTTIGILAPQPCGILKPSGTS
jgi:hypothetical protein